MENLQSATTVLLIDSNKDDRQYWAQRLHISSPDYSVLEADTGASGLAICQSQRVDCVITELTLLDMSGFQVLLTLVPRATQPRIAVIMLSTVVLQQTAKLALSNGAQAYLIKPRISGDNLDLAIRTALARVGPTIKEPCFYNLPLSLNPSEPLQK